MRRVQGEMTALANLREEIASWWMSTFFPCGVYLLLETPEAEHHNEVDAHFDVSAPALQSPMSL